MAPVQALNYATEFYSVIRLLQFHQVLARLSHHIVSEMNALLERLGIETEISVNGLLTADEIGDLITRVSKGSTGFDQALASIRSQVWIDWGRITMAYSNDIDEHISECIEVGKLIQRVYFKLSTEVPDA